MHGEHELYKFNTGCLQVHKKGDLCNKMGRPHIKSYFFRMRDSKDCSRIKGQEISRAIFLETPLPKKEPNGFEGFLP